MPEQRKLRGLTLNELIAWKTPYHPYIIDHDILLSEGTLGIYGAEGTWKSNMMLDLMFRVANGEPWFGFKTQKSPVFYFQSEVPQAPLQKRALKYAMGNKLSGENFWFCTELYEKIDKGWGFTELEKEIARTRPQLLIIDPVYNSVAAKLVDDYEVGLFLDRLNILRATYKLAIILVHHSRQAEHGEGETYHYGTDEWFGSTRFKRWLDTMIYVETTSNSDYTTDLRLTFEKTRHAESLIRPIDIRAYRNDLTFKRIGEPDGIQTGNIIQ